MATAKRPSRPGVVAWPTPPRRRIRVVFCIDNLGIGGTELNAVRTAERLDRGRFDSSLVCLQEDGPLRARYQMAGIPVRSFPIPNLYGMDAFRQGRQLARFLRSERVDVFHSHDVYSNIFGTFWARSAGTPAVIASRRWWQSLPQRKLRIANALAYRMAHCVIANAPAVADSLRTSERLSPQRISVISNFVDESAFEPLGAEQHATLLRELGVSPNAVLVGIIARLAPVKDHASLVAAVALLHARWPELRCIVVGDGECRGMLEAQSRQLGLEGVVRFAGLRPHAPNLHHLFDISVLCSVSEGFPNSLVEAMAAGRPIVATAVGGNSDAVRQQENGLLVPPQNPEALAAAIEELLQQPDLRRTMGAAGLHRARAEYSDVAALHSLESLYERLLAP